MFFIHSFVCFVITAIVLEDLKKKEPQNVAPQLGNVNNLVAQVAHSFFINFVLPLTSNATCHIYHTIAHILFIYLLTPHFSNLSQLYTSLSHTISCTSPPIHPFISNKLPHTPSLTIKPSYQPSYTISNIPPPVRRMCFSCGPTMCPLNVAKTSNCCPILYAVSHKV